MNRNDRQTRREFMHNCIRIGTGAVLLGLPGISSGRVPVMTYADHSSDKRTICAFSRVFEFLGDELFTFFADTGFDGIDLTVRPGGFVSPENVEKELDEAVNKAAVEGLTIPMIATNISQVSDPLTEKILKTASGLGIKSYRMGYYWYNNTHLTPEENLKTFERHLLELAELNEKYGIQGHYQNHVGGMFGSAIWDLWTVLKNINSPYMGCQYDIRHAVAEGLTSWKNGLIAISPYTGSLCMKDFIYERNKQGKWDVRSVPLGTGAVDTKSYFSIIKEKCKGIPISMHFEFPLLTEEDSSLTIKEKMKQMAPAVINELEVLKKLLYGS